MTISFPIKFFLHCIFCWLGFLSIAGAHADSANANAKDKESPWLATPLISVDPKLGASIGAMASYLFKVDQKSPTSMVGTMGTYSDSDSMIYGAFSRIYFGEDHHRIIAGVFGGEINNEYDDFLGTGWPLQTQDNLLGIFARYSYRITDNWFVGALGVSANYAVTGSDKITEGILELIGLTGFDSNGIGFIAERDTRDNQNLASKGSLFSVQNLAYRKSLGGDVSFDTYQIKFSQYLQLSDRHVLAYRYDSRLTHNAPVSGYSSVDLRGYTRGEYLAPHSMTFEVEDRMSLKGRWGAAFFLGAATLYDDVSDMGSASNWYPAVGGGINYLIKPQEKMLVRADLAWAKGGKYGAYLQFGTAF